MAFWRDGRKGKAGRAKGDAASKSASKRPGISRRDFLRVSGTAAATAAMVTAGCQKPVENTVAFNERPEELRALGKPKNYTTVLDGVPVLARNREGRPILLSPNPDHPSPRTFALRHQAALMDLYDPDRAHGPMSVRRSEGAPTETTWRAVGEVFARAAKGRDGKKVVLLTAPLHGRAERDAAKEFTNQLGGYHVSWTAIEEDAAAEAWQMCFGNVPPPRARLERADLVVGFGAEFIDRPESGLESGFAARREPDAEGGMSRFVQFESRLSLTGANADKRVRVRDSQMAELALAVAHELTIKMGVGQAGNTGIIRDALGRFTVEAVSKRTGVDVAILRGIATELAAKPGRSAVLAGGSASATKTGLALETAVCMINQSLGNYGSVFELGTVPAPFSGGAAELHALTADMEAGKVAALVICGANPVFDAPPVIPFAAAMKKVPLVISLNDRIDETSAHADYLAPASHALESWGDADLGGGLHAVRQPLLRPLYDTHGLLDVLVAWGSAAGVGGGIAAAAAATQPPTDAAKPKPNTSGAYHYVRKTWGQRFLRVLPGSPQFEDRWDEVLRRGYVKTPSPAVPKPSFDAGAISALGQVETKSRDGYELQLFPHSALWDGRSGNNGWLLELPDPISRITWGSWLAMSPRRFDEMELENGDLIDVTYHDQKVTLPVFRQAGMHDDVLAAPLGFGRTATGFIGNGVGVNLFALMGLDARRKVHAGLSVSIAKNGRNQPLAITQGGDVVDREVRPIVPITTLEEWKADPKAGTEQMPGGPSAWAEHEYENQRWGMVIDLSRCNGCGKCAIGCQSENNIPVVGAQGVREGREMSWIRIDRYYDALKKEGGWGDDVFDGPLEVVEEPVTVFEPMLCQHCENAPCETVCPFNATMHSEDGLNQQVYNRCVGTRYCANNCPFKVRRYNWFEYSTPQTNALFAMLVPSLERYAELNTRGRMQMKNNPEVTVRSRGVMEKCSFCVQRIREARAEATRDGRPGEIPDGAVVPACMEACPTGAISFGDLNDPKSRVAARTKDPRAMKLLEMTGVKPSIAYLTKVRNDNA